MMHSRSPADRERNEWLLQAATRRAPVVLNARIDDRWIIRKSRFRGVDRERGRLLIEYPSQPEHGQAEIDIGQCVGLSFRRGHKKCVFEAQVIGQDRSVPEGKCPVLTLSLCWPDRIQELQRRLYCRAKVPPRLSIPVDICPQSTRSAQAASGVACRGLMLDLSAGGMNIALPAEKRIRLKPGDTVTCTFALEPGQTPQEISGRLRHCEPAPGGHLRVGLQFLGLEASAEGCQTLQRIGRAANRFRKMETRRRTRRL